MKTPTGLHQGLTQLAAMPPEKVAAIMLQARKDAEKMSPTPKPVAGPKAR